MTEWKSDFLSRVDSGLLPVCTSSVSWLENNTTLVFVTEIKTVTVSHNKHILYNICNKTKSLLYIHYSLYTKHQHMTVSLYGDLDTFPGLWDTKQKLRSGHRSRVLLNDSGDSVSSEQHIFCLSHMWYEKNYRTPHIFLLHTNFQPPHVIYIHEDIRMSYILKFVTLGQQVSNTQQINRNFLFDWNQKTVDTECYSDSKPDQNSPGCSLYICFLLQGNNLSS